MRDKKGVSEILATIVLLAITIATVSLIFAVVKNLVQENIQSSESCRDVFDKIEINPRYTCYNSTVGDDELWFSISVGNIEKIDDVLVAISGQGESVSFRIVADNASRLEYYNRTRPVNMSIPGKNQGLSYIYKLPAFFNEEPDRIEIAPIIDGEVCGDLPAINEFDSCSTLI